MKTKNDSGSILVIVVILAALAGALASGIVIASGTSIKQTQRTLNFEHAFYAAETGIERSVASLSAGGISAIPSNGALGDASFIVSATNLGGDIVLIRSDGEYQNTTRSVEVRVFYQPLLFDPQTAVAAVAVYGENTEIKLQGSALISGHDWKLCPDFNNTQGSHGESSGLSTNPSVAGVLFTHLSTDIDTNIKHIEGSPPQTYDASQLAAKADWEALATALIPKAHHTVSGNYGDAEFGTRSAPKITVVDDDTTLAGNGKGAGILIIMEGKRFHATGTFLYEGLVIILTDGTDDDTKLEFHHSGTARFFGSVIMLGDYINYRPTGTPDTRYSSAALANLANIDGLTPTIDMQSWREVKAN